MISKDKVVYIHKRKKDGQVFYVGMGCISRPHHFEGRSSHWKKYVKIYGKPEVKIVRGYLTILEAQKLETKLIYHYGLKIYSKGTLVNLNYGEYKKKPNQHPSHETLLRYFKNR
jgi:hypothetical protein|tara:strand:+ start:229 stop:570 length:342 start_codon:yes stop_codon:yes gene_type:complete